MIRSLIALMLLFGSAAYSAQLPGKFIQNGAITAAKMNSGAATSGQALLADGASGAAYGSVALLGCDGGADSRWLAGTSVVSPNQDTEFNSIVWKFTAADAGTQSLFRRFKIPSSYSAGTKFNITVDFYGEDATTATLLLLAQSTLIHVGTDAANSTTNQRTTTNSAVAQSATAYVVRQATLDLTDSTGHINGVALSAGDEILVKLYRGTDTSTNDLRFVPDSTYCKFQ